MKFSSLTDEQKGLFFEIMIDDIVNDLINEDCIIINEILLKLANVYNLTTKEIMNYLKLVNSKYSTNNCIVGYLENVPIRRTSIIERCKRVEKKIQNKIKNRAHQESLKCRERVIV